MCRQVTCRRCGNTTWAGCGQHVDQVMAVVSKFKRCQCPPGLLCGADLRRSQVIWVTG
jgi:hypothetical protein